jgi:hypothetical protein
MRAEHTLARTRTFITDAFLQRIRQHGALAEAAQRLATSTMQHEPLPKMSTWALVCEEVVDTEYDAGYYERVAAEILRRGVSRAELEEMRVFAWETAGWLNFEKVLWEWCGLDEEDVRRAIALQFEEGEIDDAERMKRIAFLERYTCAPHLAEADHRAATPRDNSHGPSESPPP